MTNREFYNEIVLNENVSEDVKAFAKTALEKMDEANEKRKNKPTKAQLENAPLLASIEEMLTAEAKTASDFAAALGVSVQKASSLLRQLVKEEKASVCDVKIPKKGLQKAYSIPTPVDVID